MTAVVLAAGVKYGLAPALGLGGIWLGSWLANRRADRTLDRKTKLLALEVAGILEKFANSSTGMASDISEDDGNDRDGYIMSIAALPQLPESHDLWSELDLKVADAINRLKDTREAFDTRLDGSLQFCAPHEVQEEARLLNILLAVEAWKLAEKIRKRYKHGKPVTAGYWPVYLREQYQKIPKKRRKLVFNSFRKPWWQFW